MYKNKLDTYVSTKRAKHKKKEKIILDYNCQ